MDLFLVTFSTTGEIDERLIVSGLRDPSSLSWSPDGSYFTYLTESESVLHVHEASGAEVATHTLPSERSMEIQWIASSNDLLVDWRGPSAPGMLPVKQVSIARASDAFAPERVVLEEPAPAERGWNLQVPAATDDGRWLLMH
jgi:hypothetical protein